MTILIGVNVEANDDDGVTINYVWETQSEPSAEEKECADRIITAIRDEIKKIGLDTLLDGGWSSGLEETGVTDTRNYIP
ncbi:MAG: hypothetical protein SVT56_01835 [Chloroflexota bacterium]|nr:hypothetical protein [Chloroflexota bacterium]